MSTPHLNIKTIMIKEEIMGFSQLIFASIYLGIKHQPRFISSHQSAKNDDQLSTLVVTLITKHQPTAKRFPGLSG